MELNMNMNITKYHVIKQTYTYSFQMLMQLAQIHFRFFLCISASNDMLIPTQLPW